MALMLVVEGVGREVIILACPVILGVIRLAVEVLKTN